MPAELGQTMGGVFILGSSPACSSHPALVRKEGFKSELRPVLCLAWSGLFDPAHLSTGLRAENTQEAQPKGWLGGGG